MWTWILIVAGYAAGMLAFHLLGGITAAGRAIENWGRTSSARRLERSGLDARTFAKARLGRAARRDSAQDRAGGGSPESPD